MNTFWLTLALLAVICGAASASETFTGTYTRKVDNGDNILKLQQDKEGAVTGSFTAFGATLEITGKVEGSKMTGTATLKGAPVKFYVTATREGSKLTMEVTEEGPDHQPDTHTTERIVFTKTDGDSTPAGKANPLSKGSPAPFDPLLGTFTSKDMTVVVEGGAGTYKGTISLDGKTYPFSAKKDGPGMAGTFKSGDDSFDFLAKIEGEALLLKTGDTVYMMVRKGAPASQKPANPLEKRPSSNPLATGASNGSDAAGDPSWNVLRHPIGISVRYPKDWTVKEIPNSGYQLIPAGLGPDAPEAYIIGGQPADGITSAEDPRVAMAAQTLLAQIAPALRRVGEVEKIKTGAGPGIGLTFEGGPNGRARVYIVIIKGQAIGLTGLGAKEKVDAREPVLRKIFTSFSSGEGEKDPQVVGVWNRLGTTSLESRDNVGRIQASSVGDHHRTLVLRPDGTCISREVDRTIALGAGVGIDTGDQVTTKTGHWNAGQGRLVLLWDKGEGEQYQYRITGAPGGRQLVFVLDKGRGMVWAEGR